MPSLPGDRNYGGQRNDPNRGRRDQDPRWSDVPRRPVAGYWDARDEERMHRAQADFDYRGASRWDEQLGGYRYTERNYPEERYAARSGQGRDYGPRRDAGRPGRVGGEGYRPRWGDETTGRGYAGELGQGYSGEAYLGQGYYGAEHTPDGRRPDYAAGRFRGRGPSGYRRSDERIREDVNDRLTDDPYLDASGIQVKVESCEVTLDGSVNTRACRRRAENLVEEISGVTHVQNNLRVQDADRGQRNEADGPDTGGATAIDTSAAPKSEAGKRSS